MRTEVVFFVKLSLPTWVHSAREKPKGARAQCDPDIDVLKGQLQLRWVRRHPPRKGTALIPQELSQSKHE